MKEFFSDRRSIIIISCVALIILVSLIIISLIGNSESYKKKTYEKNITSMAKDFYENFYYDLVTKDLGKEQIERFETNGIDVTLSTLEKRNLKNKELVQKFKRINSDESCNKDNTKVMIYPKSPYDKQNYELKVILDCGFKEE